MEMRFDIYSFHKNEIHRMIDFLHSPKPCQQLVIFGEVGIGKSFSIQQALSALNLHSINITFESDDLHPLYAFEIALCLDKDNIKESALICLTRLLQQNCCLVFENYEYCSEDANQLIMQLIDFYKLRDIKSVFIFEYNSIELDPSPKNNEIYFVEIKPIDKTELFIYLNSIFEDNSYNKILFSKLMTIADGNVRNLHLSIKMLLQKGIIFREKNNKFIYTETEKEIPSSLISLYISLYDDSENYIRKSLQKAALLGEMIYPKLIKDVFDDCIKIDRYLNEICKDEAFILARKKKYEQSIFQSDFRFASDIAIDAITEKTPQEQINNNISMLYDHLTDIYKNNEICKQLSNQDKLMLLLTITKTRNKNLSANHIPYVEELMNYHFDHMLYHSVVEDANKIIKLKSLNNQQIHKSGLSFFTTYFKALMSIGQYEKIIAYKDEFTDDSLLFIIALAYYNIGNPNAALDVLKDIKAEIGEVYSLYASIYDWLGDCVKSVKYFKKALKNINDDSELKYQLYKRYSMYIDFEIPECKKNMLDSLDYFKSRNKKQYAECLHNIGTEMMFIFENNSVLQYLEDSIKCLTEICDREIYYPENSLAIFDCMKGDISCGISRLEKIDVAQIPIDFCKLAIFNNLLNGYIQLDNDNAENLMDILKSMIENMCKSVKIEDGWKKRPDIQHQIRHFFFNRGYYYEKKNDFEKAQINYKKSLISSNYKSISTFAIKKSLDELNNKSGTSFAQKLLKKNYVPSRIESFVYDNKMFLCPVMFWG